MDNASFGKRVFGGIIDFFILIFILNTSGAFLLFAIQGENMNMQSSPFIILSMILTPLELLVRMIKYPSSVGDTSSYYMLLVILFFIEAMYYTLMQLLFKGTIGHLCLKMRLYTEDGDSINTGTIVLRSFLKTISRYLFALPLLTILFTKRKQALHDLFTKIIVR